MITHQESFQRKLNELRQWMEKGGIEFIRFRDQRTITWLTGIRAHVNIANSEACCVIIVSRHNVFVVTNNIEAKRLQEEEFDLNGIDWIAYPWYESDGLERILRKIGWHEGSSCTDSERIGDELLQLYLVLDPWEQNQLKSLSKRTAKCVENVAKVVQPGQTEQEVAGMMAQQMISNGIDPVVLLVAADERAIPRKHPLPTEKPISSYAMLVTCGRSGGLISSVTRAINFGELDDQVAKYNEAVGYISAVAVHSTIPGNTVESVFQSIRTAYVETGFPDEWRNHHQGGLTGYGSRLVFGRPGESRVLETGMAAAWNPSMFGVKSEDTCLVRPGEPEILTLNTETWPVLKVETKWGVVKRPDILIR